MQYIISNLEPDRSSLKKAKSFMFAKQKKGVEAYSLLLAPYGPYGTGPKSGGGARWCVAASYADAIFNSVGSSP
jgi:hypothetical protein